MSKIVIVAWLVCCSVINVFVAVYPMVPQLDEKTLVIFDIDNTDDALFNLVFENYSRFDEQDLPLIKELHTKFVQHMREKYRAAYCDKISEAKCLVYDHAQRSILCDADTAYTIARLQKSSVKVMAVTFALSEEYEQCHRVLAEHGINFGSGFENCEIKFLCLPSFNNNFPLFRKGILMTCLNGKNSLIDLLEKYLEKQPEHVVFDRGIASIVDARVLTMRLASLEDMVFITDEEARKRLV
jgi:hypothetical protein